jgi:hypothetical protein
VGAGRVRVWQFPTTFADNVVTISVNDRAAQIRGTIAILRPPLAALASRAAAGVPTLDPGDRGGESLGVHVISDLNVGLVPTSGSSSARPQPWCGHRLRGP